jgi:nucleoside-diphosphate-sugar epimerase
VTLPEKSTMITGASGYIGRLLTLALLSEGRRVVLPVRPPHDRSTLLVAIEREYALDMPDGEAPALSERVVVAPFDSLDDWGKLDELVRREHVDEVVHCLACLDYFATTRLAETNVALTAALLERCKVWKIDRLVYISTAFSSGYVDGTVGEVRHSEPALDPTDYTKTKRAAEGLVFDSGLPFIIVRPSIVIGDSRDGHYTGKRYGLYQLLAGAERFLCRTWQPEVHAVAPVGALPFVHQDALQKVFRTLWRDLPAGRAVNVVSGRVGAPESRDLWKVWVDEVLKPERVYFYETVEELFESNVPVSYRSLAALGSVNYRIIGHGWDWQTDSLEELQLGGQMRVTHDSVDRCQRAFIANSERVQAFVRSRANGAS